jgi:uncharacterized membrane protein
MTSHPTKPGTYERGSDEFTRVITFSDAVFAIAMTLLIVSVTLPKLVDNDSVSELAQRLRDIDASLLSFAISFWVIGRFWIAHRQFFALLARLDGVLVGLNLVYLGFIAFMPFPTDLIGNYFQNPLAIAIYAANLAVLTGLEVLMMVRAHRHGMLTRSLTPEVYRWGILTSTTPVVFIAASVPVAFLGSSAIALLMWFAAIPFNLSLRRFKPDGADELLNR